ncbi:hypothetical protein GW17_00034116 [Ensete ventricosum]|nr:hypothetical protein GW17_00034116 [Ensete ventricosum]
MSNGFGASSYIRIRHRIEWHLRRFSGPGSTRSMTTGTTSKVAGTISGLACPDYRVTKVVLHVVLGLTRRG